MDEHNEEDAWTDNWMNPVQVLAERLVALSQTNPWPERQRGLLPQAMIYLMTELWDRGFSQSQIRAAFEEALEDMPRYAAGEESNGTGISDPIQLMRTSPPSNID